MGDMFFEVMVSCSCHRNIRNGTIRVVNDQRWWWVSSVVTSRNTGELDSFALWVNWLGASFLFLTCPFYCNNWDGDLNGPSLIIINIVPGLAFKAATGCLQDQNGLLSSLPTGLHTQGLRITPPLDGSFSGNHSKRSLFQVVERFIILVKHDDITTFIGLSARPPR
jgi:hypothetical protein